MKTQRGIWMIAGALLLGVAGGASAQGTPNGSPSGAMNNLPPAPGGPTGGAPAQGSAAPGGAVTTTTTTVVRPPAPEIYSGSGSSFVGELMGVPGPRVSAPTRVRRSPRAQARYVARVARLSKTQRTRVVRAKYRVAPIGWEAAYLPQDRFKFGRIWSFVSTETDRFYYTPSGMARKRFNPNRVIGFYSYSDALAAGYRPDPVTRPAPGQQIAQLARLYRGPELNDFVEYVYAGQIAPRNLTAIVNYALSVDRTLRPTQARPYIGSTVAKVLEAALTGDTSSIPRRFNANGPIVVTTTTTVVGGAPGMPGGASQMPGMSAPRGNLMPPSSAPTPSGSPSPSSAPAPDTKGLSPQQQARVQAANAARRAQ